jgi:hypothetical protein
MSDMPQFIYHNEKTKQFFGRYSNVTKEVEFDSKTLTSSPPEVTAPLITVEPAMSTASPSSASTLPAQSIVAETFPPISPVASPLKVTIPLSPTEKVSLSQNYRSNGTSAAMWWWQDMRSG